MKVCPHCGEPVMKLKDVDPKPDTSPRLNMDQAVQRSGVCRRTLYYWMRTSRLPYETVRGHRRVLLTDIYKAPLYTRREPKSTSEAA